MGTKMEKISVNEESLDEVKSSFGNWKEQKRKIVKSVFDKNKNNLIKQAVGNYSYLVEKKPELVDNFKFERESNTSFTKKEKNVLKDAFDLLDEAYEDSKTIKNINEYFESLDTKLEKSFDKYLDEKKILDENKKDQDQLKEDFNNWFDGQIDEKKIFRHMNESKKRILKRVDLDINNFNTEITSSSIDDLEQELLVSNNISSSNEELNKQLEEIKYSEKKFLNKIFGLGNGLFSNKIDGNLSIATENYVVRGQEKRALKEMRDIFEYFVDEKKSLSKVFEDLNKVQLVEDDGNEEYTEKVMELNNLQEEIKKYPYVSRLWEMLDDKAKAEELSRDNIWENLYADLYVGNNDDLISNKRKAVKTLFDDLDKKDSSVMELRGYINSLDTDKFFAMFTYAGIDSIQKLEDELKANAGNGVYDKMTQYLDENFDDYSKPKAVKFAQFIIKNYLTRSQELHSVDNVLDKVISGYISGRNLIDIANAGIVMEKMGKEKTIEDILNLMGNKKFDNKLDFNDGHIKTGLQFKEVVLTEMRKNGFTPEVTINKILSFSKTLFEKMGIAYSPYVEKINDLRDEVSIDAVFNLFKQDPGLLSSISDVFTKTPVPVSYIMRYGADAFDEYNKDWNNKSLDKLGENTEVKETIDKGFDSLYNKLLDEGLNDNSEIKEKLRLHYHGLMLDGSQGLKAGTSLSAFVESKIGTLSATVGVVGSGEGAQVGVMMGWNNQYDFEDDKTSVYGGLNGGISGPIWMPIATGNAGISRVINSDKLESFLKPIGERKLSLGGNVTVLPLWSRGVSASYESDKMAGIEKTTKSIAKKTAEITEDILTKLSATANGLKGLPDISIENIKSLLKEKFPKEKNKSGELEQAATNIYRGLQYFGIDETKSLDTDTITQISDMMGEFYSTSWKNESMTGLDRFHVSSAGVGVQFLAGFYPIPTVVVGLTKYRNKVRKNTEISNQRNEAMYLEGRGLREYSEVTEDGNKDIDGYLSKINSTIDSKYKIVRSEKMISVPMNIVKNDCNIVVSKEMEMFVKIEDGKLVIPSTIDLSFMKLTGGETIKHVLVIGDRNVKNDSIKIDINSQLEGDPSSFEPKVEKEPEIETIKPPIEITDLMNEDFRHEMADLFDEDSIKLLREAETMDDPNVDYAYDSQYYYRMLAHLNDFDGDDEDSLTLNKAIASLKNLDTERKRNNKQDVVLDDIISYIDENNSTDLSKVVWVLNKLKQVFAGEPKYSTMKLGDIFKQRNKNGKEVHLSLKGPNKESQFPQFLNKKALSINGDVNFSDKYESRSDLLGFTAFYRRGINNIDSRGFSMTSLGGVEIQPGTERIIENEEQRKESFCWFMDNFEVQKYEQQMLRDRIMNKLGDEFKKETFDSEKLKTLLEGSYNGKFVDINLKGVDNKEKKVKINFDMMFYLLGECANESLGLSINSIDIEEKEEPKEPKILQNLYIGDSESTNEAIYTDKKDVSVGFTAVKKKETPPKPTGGGENPKTKGGDEGQDDGGIDGGEDSGDSGGGSVDGGDVSPDNPGDVGDTNDDGTDNGNPLGI